VVLVIDQTRSPKDGDETIKTAVHIPNCKNGCR
jgi:hypothetical protein